MASSSQSGAASGAHALAAYRDAQGFLPLADCGKCGTRLIGRISQQPNSKGKRFYKCPMLEHTSIACSFYMFGEHYVEFLVKEGLLPTCFSRRGVRPDVSVTNEARKDSTEQLGDVVKDATERLGGVLKGVERSISSLENAMTALKDSEKAAVDSMEYVGKKVDRLGEIVLYVGVANLFVLVLVLLVLLVK